MARHHHAKPAGVPTWTDLMTTDTEKARTFYHAVFGWEYHVAGPEFGGYINAHINEHMVAGITGPMPGAPPMPAAWTIYFASHDIDADVAKAEKLGAKVMAPAMTVGDLGKMAILIDPTGAVFGLWQAGTFTGAMVTEEHGAMNWVELTSTDAKAANSFYVGLLGTTSAAMPGGLEYYTLSHGEHQRAGIMQADPAWGIKQSFWANYFHTDDAAATAALAVKNGATMHGPIDDTPFGHLGALVDPVGANFKIIQPPKHS